ncbi:MAG: MBL fold metallo-hydrolase [Planctomycetaceae bacterium]|jgi:glyoxylase-like metal-dependent hydrolase (beta-lactamase superfamily II)|nr:MBL fold metallo-hydrolase [Phycisphaerales bacterium]MCE2653658.1 MBL fold metallo-hydrolase [Planctomycetaceae bacterium]
MSIDVRIVSIGALSAHPLWGEKEAVRTGHATTTLITAGKARILVDPGLPEKAVVARLAERANLRPADITHVFLTSFHPDTHRGVGAFDHCPWLIAEAEREGTGVRLIGMLREAVQRGETPLIESLKREVAVMERCTVAGDALEQDVDLFPLPGVTPGLAGLLLATGDNTTLICGDAVATSEHLAQRKVLPLCADVEMARRSFVEAVQIADVLVLGRDNWVNNPEDFGRFGDEDAPEGADWDPDSGGVDDSDDEGDER